MNNKNIKKKDATKTYLHPRAFAHATFSVRKALPASGFNISPILPFSKPPFKYQLQGRTTHAHLT
jgi:hypothetical protein